MRKTLIIIIGLAIVSVVGVFVYFVAGISAVYPPIKKYQFTGSVDQLLSGIRHYTSTNPNVTLKITDTTGNMTNGYAFYMDVEIKESKRVLLYNLKCEKDGDDGSKTLIDLIGVFNERDYKTGGYSIKGIEVNNMANDFENNFLPSLKKEERMSIIAL